MARKKIIAGNWKMNMTPTEAVELVNTLKPLVAGSILCTGYRYHSGCGSGKGNQHFSWRREYVL